MLCAASQEVLVSRGFLQAVAVPVDVTDEAIASPHSQIFSAQIPVAVPYESHRRRPFLHIGGGAHRHADQFARIYMHGERLVPHYFLDDMARESARLDAATGRLLGHPAAKQHSTHRAGDMVLHLRPETRHPVSKLYPRLDFRRGQWCKRLVGARSKHAGRARGRPLGWRTG